ncbi:hypothetical protein [Haliangium ochraceum]|uniref:Uncharacterized protein n=1 Tax=Haliangium ochraceum (strain DSM 14365 / JCM 11303 / SMP-2) TaxID=502025 RepID=D0LSM6_HALO1|nr:hypothetical protein [Haliangium ochraceum]ACY17248.1 conserved hypothetical protein [Haliangium ochraceum DSM 14365]
MASRQQARTDAAFRRGDVGVDGQATEDQRDAAEVEMDAAREQLLRGRTYLGREMLTWLLWRSESGEPMASFEEQPFTVLFTGRISLRGVHEDVTELSARGATAPYSVQVRHALDRGLLVHVARVCITHGERQYEATLDAEYLDIRSAKLPQLMTEDGDDGIEERLYLAEQLSAMVDVLVDEFLAVRTSKKWQQKLIPAMKQWMQAED